MPQLSVISDRLAALITPVVGDDEIIDSDNVEDVWRFLFPEMNVFDRARLTSMLESELNLRDPALELSAGAWRLNLRQGMVRAALVMASLGGALPIAGVHDPAAIAVVVLPAVLPLVFDLDAIKLDERDGALLSEIRLRPEAATGVGRRKLYEALPKKVRSQMTFEDFEAFLSRVSEAGLADDLSSGDIRLRPEGQAKFRVTVA